MSPVIIWALVAMSIARRGSNVELITVMIFGRRWRMGSREPEGQRGLAALPRRLAPAPGRRPWT